MLSLFGKDKAPGVDHVDLYRDDEVPEKWYMVPSQPTIARDDDGDALLQFLLYARDVDRLAPEDLEIQRGFLQLSTQVAVSHEDEEKILAYLRQRLANEFDGFFLRRRITRREPILAYPPIFTQGSVQLSLLSPDMVPFTAGSAVPSLRGTNLASFSAGLNQDGAELIRQVIQKGSIPALVLYGLKFLARIPAVTITIHGDRRNFLSEVITRYNETHVTVTTTDWWFWRREIVSWYTKQWSTLTQFKESTQNLTVTIDDTEFRSTGADAEAVKALETMALTLVTQNVIPSLFEALPPLTEQQRKGHESFSQEVTGSIDMTLTRTSLVEVDANPSAQLSQIVTAEELKKHTTYVDLSNTAFQEMSVLVHANVDFESDPVFGLKVFLDYDEEDEVRDVRVKKGKEFLFRTGDEVHRFRQVMAKGADGAAKDRYRYWSEIIYEDTGETIRVPSSGSLETRERELVISYRRLGFLRVGLRLAAMPDSVKGAEVAVHYPGSGRPSARATVELSRENPTGTFFTYTGHDGDPGPYRYQVTYLMADGDRMDLPEVDGRGETLVISNPFEQATQTRFIAQANFNVVQKVIVDARYEDRENDVVETHHAELTANGESSAWSVPLRDPAKLEFSYSLIVLFKNGSRQEQPAITRMLGETVPVGITAVDALQVTLIPAVDFTRFSTAVAELEYADGNGVTERQNFIFRKDGPQDALWTVLLRERAKRSFRHRMRFVGANGNGSQQTDWTETTDTILVVAPPS